MLCCLCTPNKFAEIFCCPLQASALKDSMVTSIHMPLHGQPMAPLPPLQGPKEQTRALHTPEDLGEFSSPPSASPSLPGPDLGGAFPGLPAAVGPAESPTLVVNSTGCVQSVKPENWQDTSTVRQRPCSTAKQAEQRLEEDKTLNQALQTLIKQLELKTLRLCSIAEQAEQAREEAQNINQTLQTRIRQLEPENKKHKNSRMSILKPQEFKVKACNEDSKESFRGENHDEEAAGILIHPLQVQASSSYHRV